MKYFVPSYFNKLILRYAILTFLSVLTFPIYGCGIYGKSNYEYSYKSMMESCRIDKILVYLSFAHIDEAKSKRLYFLLYDTIVKILNSNGYDTVRLNEDEILQIGMKNKINFSYFFGTTMPSDFSNTGTHLDDLFMKYGNIFYVDLKCEFTDKVTYSTSPFSKREVFQKIEREIHSCDLMYAILNSDSHKVIVAGPSQSEKYKYSNSPYVKYERPITGDIKGENRPSPFGRANSTVYKFSGYQMSEEEFIRRVAYDSIKRTPTLKN